jgi:hypothetical protein
VRVRPGRGHPVAASAAGEPDAEESRNTAFSGTLDHSSRWDRMISLIRRPRSMAARDRRQLQFPTPGGPSHETVRASWMNRRVVSSKPCRFMIDGLNAQSRGASGKATGRSRVS